MKHDTVVVDRIQDLLDCTPVEALLPRTVYRGHSRESYHLVPTLFRQPVPNSIQSWEQPEGRLLGPFATRGYPWLEQYGASLDQTVMLACIARHHGLPVRLLDWSGNALTVLYFATRGPVNENGVILAI